MLSISHVQMVNYGGVGGVVQYTTPQVSTLPALLETGRFSEISSENSTLSRRINGRQPPCQRPRSLRRLTSVLEAKEEQLPSSSHRREFFYFLWRVTWRHGCWSRKRCNTVSHNVEIWLIFLIEQSVMFEKSAPKRITFGCFARCNEIYNYLNVKAIFYFLSEWTL